MGRHLLSKLLSRRFLTSLLVVVFGLLGIDAADSQIELIVSAILVLGGLLGFQFGEAMVDKARAENTVHLPVTAYRPSSWTLEYAFEDDESGEDEDEEER